MTGKKGVGGTNGSDITSNETIPQSSSFEKNSSVEQNPQNLQVWLTAVLLNKGEAPVLTAHAYL